jgi:eukaryotic-like serine/threonine-protein kinase
MSERCPSAETMDALVAGHLRTEPRREIEEHIERCLSCHQLVVRLLRQMSEPPEQSWTMPLPGGSGGPPANRPTRGQRMGRYLILEDAGAGGMGSVHAAYDTLLDRKVALKFLTGFHSSRSALALVLSEAGAMARLSHPNVVTVHDVGQFDGVPYLSMELVAGVTLASWRQQQPRRFREIARVMAAAARGLAAAHARGLVHRDVKPQNILVAGDRVLVTDFGLSVRLEGEGEGEDEGAPLTTIAGTPAYMAPEQFRGERIDPRTDVFGFCATLYEMLHGQQAFAGRSFAEVRAEVLGGRVRPPPSSSRAPQRLGRLALRGLDPDPARRPQTMDAIADELLADPAARWRKAALTTGIVTTAAAAFWGGGHLLGNHERRCRAGAEVVNASFDDGHRSHLRQRFAAARQAGQWPFLERQLDRFADRWRVIYGETCTATYGRHVQSEAVFALQARCLEGQRATLGALVTALSSATPRQLVQGSRAMLPEPTDCRVAGRPDTKPLPSGADAREQLKAIDQALGWSEAEQLLGELARAADSARRAVQTARQLGHEPLLAAALFRQAAVEMRRASPPSSEEPSSIDRSGQLLEQAYAAADAGGDDPRRLLAASWQLAVQIRRGQYASAQRWARRAESLLARLGGPAPWAAALAQNVGWLQLHLAGEGQLAAAPAFQRAIDLAGQLVPPDQRRGAAALAGLCLTRPPGEERIACARRSLALAEAAHGPENRELGPYYLNLAIAIEGPAGPDAESCALRRKLATMDPIFDPSIPGPMATPAMPAACLEHR